MPDIAKQERIAYLEERLKKNKDERLKATAKLVSDTNKVNKKKKNESDQSQEDDEPKIQSRDQPNVHTSINLKSRKNKKKK